MPWNLLIYPLVAGYYLLTNSNFFRFKEQRLDSQRLIFESIILGIGLLFLAYLLRVILTYFIPEFISSLYNLIPIKNAFIGTTISTLVLAFLIHRVRNFFFKKNDYLKKSILYAGNEFELLLMFSINDSRLLQFTLDNGKFYIGWVQELPIPQISKYIRIYPAYSGFRNANKELQFTSEYLIVYQSFINEGAFDHISEIKIDLVIKVENIVSVAYFDQEIYNRFNDLSGIQDIN